ncbi:MAG TPA: sigma-70 family RNA polymerase sigma factor [Candidatus Hydrogenedentes bacterium]|nr:sigma-70 family RNA polymerase sigma factor [Candidatus Hydrogenedentota bacterium]
MDGITTTDKTLLDASAAGDRQAFADIVERYKSLVCAIMYSSTGDLALSEDLAQDTFVAAWTHLGALKDSSKFRPWLCSIARNLAKRYLANRRRDVMAKAEPLDTSASLAAVRPGPRELAITEEEQAVLWRSIEQIPETYRVPLILFYREGQSADRAAQTLGISSNALRQRLHRGRQMLKSEMAAFVEQSLAKTRPGKAFGLGVLCALPRIPAWAPATQQAAGSSAEAAAWCLRPFAKLLSWCTNLGAPQEAATGVAAGAEQAAAALIPEAAAPVAKLASCTAGLGIRLVVVGSIAVAAVAGGAAYYASNATPVPAEITARTLVQKYKQALTDQQCFVLKFTNSTRYEADFGPGLLGPGSVRAEGVRRSAGELATDGHRVAIRSKRWGNKGDRFYAEENPMRYRTTFDGKEQWNYHKRPDSTRAAHGEFSIDTQPIRQGRLTPYESLAGLSEGHCFRGFVNVDALRMDVLLDNADSLTVQPAPKNLNGVDCYGLDFASKYGRGTIWLDPEHGYNIAQAEYYTKTGDVVYPDVTKRREGNLYEEHFVQDVSFEEIDGVWFPMGGTSGFTVSWPGYRETSVSTYQITSVRINPDLDALGVFSKDDIENGAEGGYFGQSGRYIWQSGKLVPKGE